MRLKGQVNQSANPIAVALGADRVFSLQTDASAGLLSWLQLQEEIARHVQSVGDQPIASAEDARCPVPLRLNPLLSCNPLF
jgi:hypothetical protein